MNGRNISQNDTDLMTCGQHHDMLRKTQGISLRSRISPGSLHSPLLFSTVLEILAKAVRQEKDRDKQEGRSHSVLMCR